MTQPELVRFIRACVRDGRHEAIILGRIAFRRLVARNHNHNERR